MASLPQDARTISDVDFFVPSIEVFKIFKTTKRFKKYLSEYGTEYVSLKEVLEILNETSMKQEELVHKLAVSFGIPIDCNPCI